MSTRITVSELDRTMSDVLNRVAYQGESFTIERGGKDVARLEPVGPVRAVTLDEVIEKLGDLHVPEGMGDDIEAFRVTVPKLEVPDWLK
jgi:antitoxin (DNA-binding transcriptional repressor) of toxin-antitoxin stability system